MKANKASYSLILIILFSLNILYIKAHSKSSFLSDDLNLIGSNANNELNLNSIENQELSEMTLLDIRKSLKLINNTISNNPDFSNQAYEKTAYIVDTYGPRLWGSEVLELAVRDMLTMLEKDGFENYYLEDVPDVRVWNRGEESLTLYDPRPYPTLIPMIGLGLSIGGNVTAEVIVVNSFDELDKLDDSKVKGKIVLFNSIWTHYGDTVKYRVTGPSRASKKGASAVIVRSVTPISWETPHTGALNYEEGVTPIPACAISLEDADMFARMQDRKQKIVVNLYMEAHYSKETTTAHNILAEFKGSEYPEEVLLMGGHIDSWDVGPQTGATDDLVGFFVCYEALRVLTKLNLRPKRTIRLIGWSGEEMGQSNNGAHIYLKNRLNIIDKHVVAFESDLGANDITGFGFTGSGRASIIINQITREFKEYGMDKLVDDGQNADVAPLYEKGIPIMRNYVESTPDAQEYFISHHTAADNMSRLNTHHLDRNVMGIAGMMYSIANLSIKLPNNDSE